MARVRDAQRCLGVEYNPSPRPVDTCSHLRYVRDIYGTPRRMGVWMPCEYACAGGQDHAGVGDCCHTCLYFLGTRCVAPPGFSFYPRVMWPIAREA